MAFLCLPLGAHEGGRAGRDESRLTKGLGLILLFLGFVCAWWSETLGGALWVGRGAWNPKPSSSGAMAILGWIFMVLAIALCAVGDDFLAEMMGLAH